MAEQLLYAADVRIVPRPDEPFRQKDPVLRKLNPCFEHLPGLIGRHRTDSPSCFLSCTFVRENESGGTPPIPLGSESHPGDGRVAEYIRGFLLQVLFIVDLPGIIFPVFVNRISFPVVTLPHHGQLMVKRHPPHAGFPCPIENEMDMVVHQAKSQDDHFRHHGLAQGDPVHSGNKLTNGGEQDTVVKTLGRAMKIMGSRVFHFFQSSYPLCRPKPRLFIPLVTYCEILLFRFNSNRFQTENPGVFWKVVPREGGPSRKTGVFLSGSPQNAVPAVPGLISSSGRASRRRCGASRGRSAAGGSSGSPPGRPRAWTGRPSSGRR